MNHDFLFPYPGGNGRVISQFQDQKETILVTCLEEPDGSCRVLFLHEHDAWQPDMMSVFVPADKLAPRQFRLRGGRITRDFASDGGYKEWYRLGVAADKFYHTACL